MLTKKIQDYMTPNVITVNENEDVMSAMNALINNKISAVPVLNDKGQLVGVLSEKCCLKIGLESAFNETGGGAVSQVMSSDIHALSNNESIFQAAQAFDGLPKRSFPVIDEHKRLVGVISTRDVLRALQDIIGK